ncbi:MAG: SCO family protein [Pseudomonadales bacterium]|nr:SCO family protein [Pseudomonadales bacterium]
MAVYFGLKMSSVAKTVSLCLGFIVIVVIMFVYSTMRTPQLSDDELRDKGVFLLPKPRDISPFSLQLADADFSNDDLKGKWSFVFFGFTHCPDVCPTSMSELGKADLALQDTTGERANAFQGVLVSVDPDRDTPMEVTEYAKFFSPRFLGATAPREVLAELTQQVNVAFAKVPDGNGGFTVDHTGNIVLINPHGHYHGFMKLPHDAETIRLTYQSLDARF